MATYPAYRYNMGFRVNGVAIPDPSVFTGAVSDLDTEGGRDATGHLHRCRVATKHPLKMEYHNIEWNMVMSICDKIKDDSFSFTFPDPSSGNFRTITAYVGDRNWESVWNPVGGLQIANLKFSVIEY